MSAKRIVKPQRPNLTPLGNGWIGRFSALGGPCEVLVDTPERKTAVRLVRLAAEEAWRIEAKYSRYRDDSLLSRLNHAGPRGLRLDEESASLITLADQLYRQSDGRFDITSGVLREVWHFDGSDRLPTPEQVERALARVGWHRVSWQPPLLALAEGMEIDLGGIGKEYAVDRALARLCAASDVPLLVNFGGDLCVSGPHQDGAPWQVGLDDPARSGGASLGAIGLKRGAIATSGDARRFLLRSGVRYGHILDPRSGWPVAGAPRSITVHAATCLEAGMLATLAMLEGEGARDLLEREGVRYWLVP